MLLLLFEDELDELELFFFFELSDDDDEDDEDDDDGGGAERWGWLLMRPGGGTRGDDGACGVGRALGARPELGEGVGRALRPLMLPVTGARVWGKREGSST